MTIRSLRSRIPAVAVVAALALLGPLPMAAAQEVPTGEDNMSVAVNTEDGSSIFRLAFSVRRVADGYVDESNTALALASCTECQTVALAFQVILVTGDADVVIPGNYAYAVNSECVECFTYASATQLVFGFDGPVRLTDEGSRRLTELQRSLRELEDRIAEMGAAL